MPVREVNIAALCIEVLERVDERKLPARQQRKSKEEAG